MMNIERHVLLVKLSQAFSKSNTVYLERSFWLKRTQSKPKLIGAFWLYLLSFAMTNIISNFRYGGNLQKSKASYVLFAQISTIIYENILRSLHLRQRPPSTIGCNMFTNRLTKFGKSLTRCNIWRTEDRLSVCCLWSHKLIYRSIQENCYQIHHFKDDLSTGTNILVSLIKLSSNLHLEQNCIRDRTSLSCKIILNNFDISFKNIINKVI